MKLHYKYYRPARGANMLGWECYRVEKGTYAIESNRRHVVREYSGKFLALSELDCTLLRSSETCYFCKCCILCNRLHTGRPARRLVAQALARGPRVLGPAAALAAHALAVVRPRAQQALVHVAREVVALAERS